ncbi:MAG TPA: hypothetical protein VMS63_08090, partial [Gaiellaceae bacterium]|nr:hypothetical protein [Gaiellaceae bacterium]
MTEAYLDELLEGLVPPPVVRADWADVLHRSRRTRRRYAVVAALAAALVVVPTAIAFGGRIAGWFEGKPAPVSIRQDFIAFNADMKRMSAFMARSGFVRKAPQAIASRAHGVLALQTADGPVYLWAAPRRGGGICWLLQLKKGAGDGSSCDGTWPPDTRLSFSTMGSIVYPSEQLIYGRALGGAVSIVVDLSDGETTKLPVVEGLFVGAYPKHVHPLKVVSYDAGGRPVAVFGTLAGGTAELSPAERSALSRVSTRGTPYPLPVGDPFVRHLIA